MSHQIFYCKMYKFDKFTIFYINLVYYDCISKSFLLKERNFKRCIVFNIKHFLQWCLRHFMLLIKSYFIDTEKNGSFTVFMSWISHLIHDNMPIRKLSTLCVFHLTFIQVEYPTTSGNMQVGWISHSLECMIVQCLI